MKLKKKQHIKVFLKLKPLHLSQADSAKLQPEKLKNSL